MSLQNFNKVESRLKKTYVFSPVCVSINLCECVCVCVKTYVLSPVCESINVCVCVCVCVCVYVCQSPTYSCVCTTERVRHVHTYVFSPLYLYLTIQ